MKRVDPALNQKAPSRALGCVFVPFFALGLFFVVMIVRQSIDSAATYTWQAVPCQIVESDVREASSPNPWFAYLRYSFSAGESLRSSRSFGAYREALLFTRRWPVGSSTTCYFDPRDPAAALLERNNTGFVLLLFLPIPLLFVFIGAAGFYSVVFRVQPKARILHPGNPVAGRRFGAVFVFVLGFVLFIGFLVGPVRHAIAARSWRTQECKILRSEIQRHRRSKGSDSFSPVILYSYVVDDQEYRSDSYSFFEALDNGWESAKSITDSYRRGSIVTCYVNTTDPDEATLRRDPSLGWLVGLLPLAVLAWGLAFWPRSN
jgi:hypothetical protein